MQNDDVLHSETETECLIWHIVGSYFKKHGMVRHQIESFDNFVTMSLPHIIQETPDINIEGDGESRHHIIISNVSIQRPVVQESDGYERSITPHLARLRSITYLNTILVDIIHDVYNGNKIEERRVYREVALCRLPCMVGSCSCNARLIHDVNDCKFDQGGYFIINGIEKVLLAQEKLHTNRTYVFPMKPPSKYKYVCELRSCHEKKLRSTSTLYIYVTNSKRGAIPEITVTMPFIDTQVSVLSVFKLLGIGTRNEILTLIFGQKETKEKTLLSIVFDNDATSDMTVEEVTDWLGKEGTKELTKERRQKYIDHIVSNELLPHMGLENTKDTLFSKAVYLSYMLLKLLRVHNGTLKCDDRDHYANKRIDTSGTLMSLLFRQVYRNHIKYFTTQVHKAYENKKLQNVNLGDMFNHRRITGAFKYAFATGNWGTQRGSTAQSGVAQIMSRMTYVASIANIRRINTPINREGKAPKPRQLHYTSWGVVCPVETPEGISCGLIKNLAMMTHVRVGMYSDTIVKTISKHVPKLLIDTNDIKCDITLRICVFINGRLLFHAHTRECAIALVKILRIERSKLNIGFDVSISWVDDTVCVDSDPGCLLRPLLTAKALPMLKSLVQNVSSYEQMWEYLIGAGAIEYIDKQEESELRVGLDIKDTHSHFTHYELHPSLINGLCASLIPFCDHNQAPRNCYQSAMGKQAVGTYASNYPRRMDTVAHVLCSPQKSLVTTRIDEILNTHELATGMNAIVIIMCYGGFNQEDSLIVNQAALERGMFRSMKFQTYKEEERNIGADSETFENPEKCECTGMRVGCYGKLNDDGMPTIGSHVGVGDVILGKTITTSNIGNCANRTIKRDRSTLIKHSEDSIVDAILKSKTKEGCTMVKIRTRSTRQPQIGDKLSSRHGQKGVIGMILPECDMPFTKDGMIPDIIVNPHAIPSRMTIGQLMECLLGKLCCVRASCGDATPFRGTSINQLASELEMHGYDGMGKEILYNGMSGEQLEGRVFIGPTYYQRLKHMVHDKHHARSRGPVQILTRQPVEGRAREGGLRFGEMERDCIISHGASNVLTERLFEQSDPFVCTVCQGCGMLAQCSSSNTLLRDKEPFCNNCKSGKQINEVGMPYAFKLLVQELMAMNIATRLRLSVEHREISTVGTGTSKPFATE